MKVCCIATVREADIAIQAGADALGLVAAMPSGHGSISDQEIAASPTTRRLQLPPSS